MNSRRDQPVREGVGASSVTLPNDGAWRTVLDYFVDRFPSVSADAWRARFAAGAVLDAEGQPVAASVAFRAQARFYYYRQLAQEVPVPFEAHIVFRDDFLVVADKPHFLPVVPSGRYVQETLLVRLKRATGIDTLTPMHRIDRETAGLVVFVIQPRTRGAYQSLFHEGRVRKQYEAIAPLGCSSSAPSLDARQFPLRFRACLRESAQFMQMDVVAGEPNSETHIERLETDRNRALGRYRLSPITGKKHQLRVHMNALGIPICNDAIYPVLQPAATDDFSRPLQLLAQSIAFEDPISGAMRAFESTRRLEMWAR